MFSWWITFIIILADFCVPLTDGGGVFTLHSTLEKLEVYIEVWLRTTRISWFIFAGRRPGVFFHFIEEIVHVKLHVSLHFLFCLHVPGWKSSFYIRARLSWGLGTLSSTHVFLRYTSLWMLNLDLKFGRRAYCINLLSSTTFRQSQMEDTVCYIVFQELKNSLSKGK